MCLGQETNYYILKECSVFRRNVYFSIAQGEFPDYSFMEVMLLLAKSSQRQKVLKNPLDMQLKGVFLNLYVEGSQSPAERLNLFTRPYTEF